MIKLYKILEGKLSPVQKGRLQYEDQIQTWVAERPELLGIDLLIIGREVETDYGGWIDLLGLDDEGNLALIELKRDRTPRDVIAQALDYASWVDKLSTREIHELASKYLGKSLEQAFQEHFKASLPDSLNESHTIYIVASSFDASSERIVRYLYEAHNVAINTAFFTVFDDGGQMLLATDWLLDQSDVIEKSERKAKKWTADDLQRLAEVNKIAELVRICRHMSDDAKEQPSDAFGGSFRYWFKDRMVFGVNVSGGRRRPSAGELDVWIPALRFAETTSIPEQQLRDTLKAQFGAMEAGTTDCVVRLKTAEQANGLMKFIKNCIHGIKDVPTAIAAE